MKVIEAYELYTGGNIYNYYGQLEDGTWFFTCDDYISGTYEELSSSEFEKGMLIKICNTISEVMNDDGYPFDWQLVDEHCIEDIVGIPAIEIWNQVVDMIPYCAREKVTQ